MPYCLTASAALLVIVIQFLKPDFWVSLRSRLQTQQTISMVSESMGISDMAEQNRAYFESVLLLPLERDLLNLCL